MAINFNNFFQGVFGTISTMRSNSIIRQGAAQQASSIVQGGEIAAQGALISAQGFRQAIQGLSDTLDFNLKIEKINTKRKLSTISTNFQRTIGRQLTQTAKSGISLTSKSSLMLQTEAANIFTNQILNTKIDSENARRSQVFQTQLRQTQLENQARAAEFRAQAERVLASNRAAQVSFQGSAAASRNNPISSLLGTLFR